MRLVRAFGNALVLVVSLLLAGFLWIGTMYVIDMYVLAWFGLPTDEGIGILITLVLSILVMVTWAEYDSY